MESIGPVYIIEEKMDTKFEQRKQWVIEAMQGLDRPVWVGDFVAKVSEQEALRHVLHGWQKRGSSFGARGQKAAEPISRFLRRIGSLQQQR